MKIVQKHRIGENTKLRWRGGGKPWYNSPKTAVIPSFQDDAISGGGNDAPVWKASAALKEYSQFYSVGAVLLCKRPTIQTVAERAGVSRGTVDRVLNNRAYVRADVRERVLQAIRETGYLSPREAHRRSVAAQQQLPPVKVGVVLPNWGGPFREEVTRGIEEARSALAARGAEIRVAICESDLPVETIELLDALLAWGAQGIALCALNDITIEAKVNELADRGVPCITFNSDLPASRRLCFVGQDYAKSGRIAAELLSKCIPPDAKVLAMVGNLEYHGHRTRLDGFCRHLHDKGFYAGQIEVVETYNDYRVTYNKVAEALHSIPGLCAIYMANRSVTGCVDAVKAAGMAGKIRIIAHDMSPRRRQMLQEGALDLTITQDLYSQGYQPPLLLCGLLQQNRKPETDQQSAKISIICAENLD